MKSSERRTAVEEVLERWKRLKEENKGTTIEDLSLAVREDPTELRQRLEAVASMMSFLGMGAGGKPHAGSGDRTSTRGVLETLSIGGNPISRVLLRETEVRPDAPLHHARGSDESALGTRYRIDGEIARGGMGTVLKGRDPDLGRDVALKVLRDDFRENAEMIGRFVEEAQIGGQLQHPGIVPVYELGTLEDRRPFFTMKLVKGDTLAKLLAGRPNPSDGLPRFVSIFSSIAQTVAYAHALGVIHRDLKPSNVMVGAFGEVQVMDWGLAKVLPRGGIADDARAGKISGSETVIATARSGDGDSNLSQAGSVLGTPSYMAPEQARGQIDRVDERADVFALGSVLCEMLTGLPAFTGQRSGEIQAKAARGDLLDAYSRLDASAVDHELIDLAKHCLASEPAHRPASAGIVSERVTSYLSGVQERLRMAELTSVEERGRRRLTTVTAAAMILLMLLGAGGYAWNQRQYSERMAKTRQGVDEALADASRLLGEARSAPPSDVGRWSAAVAAAKRAEGLLAQGEADANLAERVEEFIARVELDRAAAAEKLQQTEIDKRLLEELELVRGNLIMHRDLTRADAQYRDAFRRAGLDLDATGTQEAGRWLASRSDPVELVGYLDYWAFVRRQLGGVDADWRRLVAAARAGDPDPWRDALRAKLGRDDAEAVGEFRKIADDPTLENQPAPGLLLLARQLRFCSNDGARSAQILRRAARRYPGDFRVHVELALASGALVESGLGTGDVHERPEEAIRHLTTALGIRPASVTARVVLNFALLANRNFEEAEAVCREAVRLKPDDCVTHGALANSLRWQGKHDEAAREIHEAIRLNPNDAGSHGQLATLLRDQLKFDESLPEYREAIRLKPNYFGIYLDYAHALRRKTDYQGALDVIRKAQSMSSRPIYDLYHPPEWFAKIESLAALAERLPKILTGEDRPKDMTERLDVAQMCTDKGLKAAALRFWTEALKEDPKLGEDRKPQHRYNAACMALLVASGQSKDATALNDMAKAELRRRAFDWLRAELAAWNKLFESGSAEDRSQVLTVLRWWPRDVDLVSIREALALAKLPEGERKDWESLWKDYDALMRKGGEVKKR